jgi:type 1 glutamine amidotransferase
MSFLLSGLLAATQIVIVAGPGAHAPGAHEEAAGARVMEYCLEHAANLKDVKAQAFIRQWPKDEALLDSASSVVFIGDTFPPLRLPGSAAIMAKLAQMMNRGCGLVCVHYATGLTGADLGPKDDPPLLHWLGGYFATAIARHRSIARIMPVTVTPTDSASPILRGWRAFHFGEEEPYYNLVFLPPGRGPSVVPIATALIPPEVPRSETLAWTLERSGGGLSFGVVLPHFFRDWESEDLRRLILNGIVWSAKLDVPAGGVRTTLPDLSVFQPVSVMPRPRREKPKSIVILAQPQSANGTAPAASVWTAQFLDVALVTSSVAPRLKVRLFTNGWPDSALLGGEVDAVVVCGPWPANPELRAVLESFAQKNAALSVDPDEYEKCRDDLHRAQLLEAIAGAAHLGFGSVGIGSQWYSREEIRHALALTGSRP